MPEINSSGAASRWHDRDGLSDDLSAKEPLPTYENVPTAPPDYTSQRAPTIREPEPELRWTMGPETERERIARLRNNLYPAESLYSGRNDRRNTGGNHQLGPEQNEEEVGRPNYSRFAILELTVRILSWFAALGAFSSAIYVSVHFKTLRQAAAFGQLAALFPFILDSIKMFSLTSEKQLKKTSSGRFWYADMLCMIGAGLTCSFLWRFGERDGVFEPFGSVNAVTVATALMATNGAFRFVWFIIPLTIGCIGCCCGGSG